MRIIKHRFLMLLIVGGLIILGLTYWLGKAYTSKDAQVSRIILAIKHDQKPFLNNRVLIKHQEFQTAKTSFSPMINYYKQKPTELKQLKQQLLGKSQTYNYNYDLVRSGHSFLFFPKYSLQVSPILPTIKTNVTNAEVKINGQVLGKTNHKHIYQAGSMMPGLYKVSVSSRLKNQLLTETKTFDWNNRAYEEADIPLKISDFMIKGYPKASVLINGKKVGNLNNKGFFSVRGYPINAKTIVQLKVNSGNKTFTSKPYTVQMKNNGKYIEPEFAGIASFEEASNLIGNVWTGLNGNIKTPKDAEDNNYDNYFIGGIKNESFIKLIKTVDKYEHDKKIANFFYDTRVSSVIPYKNNQTKVRYNTNVIITPTNNQPNKLRKVSYEAILQNTSDKSEVKILQNRRIKTISEHVYKTDTVSKLKRFK